jgi:hypothetical protein
MKPVFYISKILFVFVLLFHSCAGIILDLDTWDKNKENLNMNIVNRTGTTFVVGLLKSTQEVEKIIREKGGEIILSEICSYLGDVPCGAVLSIKYENIAIGNQDFFILYFPHRLSEKILKVYFRNFAPKYLFTGVYPVYLYIEYAWLYQGSESLCEIPVFKEPLTDDIVNRAICFQSMLFV